MKRTDWERVLEPFGEAAPLPRRAFVDPEVLELEERAVFASAWIPVGHEADLPSPGSWFKTPLRGKQLIVIRAADLSLRALDAVCSHRGTLLCAEERGVFPRLEIECPYHGWKYSSEGKLNFAPGLPAHLPLDRFGLGGARVATLAGVVFVCFDEKAPDLLDSIDGGPPWLSRARLGALARARRAEHLVEANWKVLVGNFQESHHFAKVHPGLERRTPWKSSRSILGRGWLGGEMLLNDESETVSESGKRLGRPFVAAEEDRWKVLDALIFPLWLTSLQPDYLLTYRLAPLAVDRTLVVSEIHVHASALKDRTALADLEVFWDRTNAEDRAICELQQRGLSASPTTPNLYAESEDGLHAFEQLVARAYLAAG